MTSDLPMVSVVIPCRNEAAHIAGCLDSVADGDYPIARLEILVVDGKSDDGTREIVESQRQRRPFIRLLDNPKRTIPSALNVGIRAAAGTVILRLDAHCRYGPHHVRECVRYLETSGADSVGGRIITVPRAETPLGAAIAIALSERFGVGSSQFRVVRDGAPAWVATVPFPCFRRDVFDRVGLFDETVERSEDIEFHQRMKAHGCRTLFVPSIVSHYYARSEYRPFAAHAFENGRWAILPTKHTGRLVVTPRHLVPLFAVTILGVLAVLALFADAARWTLLMALLCYGTASLAVSLHLAWRERQALLLVWLPIVFLTLHAGYGVGSLAGTFEVIAGLVGPKRLQPTGTA